MTVDALVALATVLVEAEGIQGADAISAIAERHLSAADYASFVEQTS